MATSDSTDLDAAVRALLDEIAAPAALEPVDLESIGRAVVAFAARDDVARRAREFGPNGGSVVLHAAESGPRVTLVRRPEGQLSAIHDHGTWVAIAPIAGREFHRRYEVAGGAGSPPRPVDVRSLEVGAVLTLLPPHDVHDHGHVAGEGHPADLVIVTGADQTRFKRTEWDHESGRPRTLAPGDRGRWLASEPFPGT